MTKHKKNRKVRLPVDENGDPIDVGYVLMWGDGTIMKVDHMVWYGDWHNPAISNWTIHGEHDDEYSDNPEGCRIIHKGRP